MEQKMYPIFEDFFDDIEDVQAMTSEVEVDSSKDNSNKRSLYVMFLSGWTVNKKTNTGFSGKDNEIGNTLDNIGKIVVRHLNMLSFIENPDVEFYGSAYDPDNCDAVSNVGNCVFHYEKNKRITTSSFGVKMFFGGNAKNFNQCLKLMYVLNRIFDTVQTKLAYNKNYFIVRRYTDDITGGEKWTQTYIDSDTIKLYNISNREHFNKLTQDNKNEILALLRTVCDNPSLASLMYKYYKTDISKELLTIAIPYEKTKRIASSEIIYGKYDVSTLLEKIAGNNATSACVLTMTLLRPDNTPDIFINRQKVIELCNENKVDFKCLLRNKNDISINIVLYSTPFLYDNREFILILGANAEFRQLYAQYYKSYRKEKTTRFYELIEYCNFKVDKVLDYMVREIDGFDEDYKSEILTYLS